MYVFRVIFVSGLPLLLTEDEPNFIPFSHKFHCIKINAANLNHKQTKIIPIPLIP
jgi:hypothetical protein